MLLEYTVLVLKLSVFIGIAVNLAHVRQARVIRLALGIILLSAIMLPIVDIIDENGVKIDEIKLPSFNDEDVNDETVKGAFEDGIRDYICSEYSLLQTEVRVTCDGFDLSTLSAEKIYVTLSGSGMYVDYRRLEGVIAEEFTRGGACEIEFDIG